MMGENAKKLFEDVKNNNELKEKFKNIKDINDIVSVAKAEGYDITVADIEAVTKIEKGELKDDDLQSVAGGGFCFISLTLLVQIGGQCIG